MSRLLKFSTLGSWKGAQLYLTPLYRLSLNTAGLHYLIHIHFLLAGYLFIWSVLAGPDTSPHSPSFKTRFAVLFISMAAHANLGKIMYGYLWPRNTPHSPEQIQSAAQLMYYGGDLAEILLLVLLLSFWYRDRHRKSIYGAPRPDLAAAR